VEGGSSEVGWVAGGVAVFVALFAKLRRPRALLLEDKRSEVETLGIAFRTIGDAMDKLQHRLDACEEKHEACERGYDALRQVINKMRPDDPIPPYSHFTRGTTNEEQL
jgi:hypothetical protein